jgi:hypothetical protein
MERQAHVALIAGRHVAAGRAQHEGREAPAVDEEQGLFAAGERLLEGVQQLRREDGVLQGFVAAVDGCDLRAARRRQDAR